MGGGLRYFGGAVAFGFAALWILASLEAALVCLLSALVGYGAVLAAERARARLATRASRRVAASKGTPALPNPPPETMPLWADALNNDLGHIYDPSAATSLLSREAEYGWPRDEDTAITSGPLQ